MTVSITTYFTFCRNFLIKSPCLPLHVSGVYNLLFIVEHFKIYQIYQNTPLLFVQCLGCLWSVRCKQEYTQGSLLTHQFSNGDWSKHSNSSCLTLTPPPQFCVNITDATFVIVYFCSLRQHKKCVNVGPFNVLVSEPHVTFHKNKPSL